MDKLFKSASLCGGKSNEEFHRKIYYDCVKFIENKFDIVKNFLVLTGPRKCGKTVCLRQLEKQYGYEYFNFKEAKSEDDKYDFMYKIMDASDTVFLLDEVTYIPNLIGYLSELDTHFNMSNNNVKVILTGSQMFILSHCSSVTLSTQADYIHTSYLDFEEWLLWTNKIKSYNKEHNCNKEEYIDYLFDISKFTGIDDNVKYIKSCIDETVRSEYYNAEAIYNVIFENTGYDMIGKILDVIYANMVYLHKIHKYEKYISYKNELTNFYNKNINSEMKYSKFKELVDNSISISYNSMRKLKSYEFREIVIFLLQTDLVTLVFTQDNKELALSWLRGDATYDIEDIYSVINICVKNPNFYINFIREIMKSYSDNDIKKFMSDDILGSMFECSIRGLITYIDKSNYQTEFVVFDKDNVRREIDYINYRTNTLLEISLGKKHTHAHLEWFNKNIDINNEFNYICIKDCESTKSGNIDVFNCYDYLLYLSRFDKRYLGYFYTNIIPKDNITDIKDK